MKKNSIFKSCVAFIVAILIFNSCSDSTLDSTQSKLNKEKAELINKSLSEQFGYINQHLGTIQKAFLSQTQSHEFKQVLYSEIEKQFDGDENVLIEELFKRDNNLLAQISESRFLNKSDDLNQSLDAFKNIGTLKERFNLYPQIYIHNYWNLKEKGFKQNPIIVTYNGDETEILEGLTLKANGEIEKIQVDGSIANENEVWVISLNENYNGEPLDNFVADAKKSNGRVKYTGDCIVTPSCNRDNTDWTNMEMDKFQITCRKETWAAGNSDVWIARWACFENFIDPDFQQFRSPNWIGNSAFGQEFLSVDNGLQGHCFEMNFIAYQGMNPDDGVENNQQVKGDLFFYVIFEHDGWPAGTKYQKVDFTNQGYPVTYTTLNIEFRSTETPFGFGVVTAKPIYRNCSPYFGCGYHNEQICNQYYDFSCSEVNWITGM